MPSISIQVQTQHWKLTFRTREGKSIKEGLVMWCLFPACAGRNYTLHQLPVSWLGEESQSKYSVTLPFRAEVLMCICHVSWADTIANKVVKDFTKLRSFFPYYTPFQNIVRQKLFDRMIIKKEMSQVKMCSGFCISVIWKSAMACTWWFLTANCVGSVDQLWSAHREQNVPVTVACSFISGAGCQVSGGGTGDRPTSPPNTWALHRISDFRWRGL